MGFVGILVALAAGISVWMYRARNAADAAQGVLDMASDAKAAARRFGYRRKNQSNPLDTVDDARLSAAGMLVSIAKLDGDLSREQVEGITRACIEGFEVDSAEAADMTAFGRWLSQQGEAEEVVRRLARGLRGQMDAERSASLYAMMEQVASIEGGAPSERQVQAFDGVRRVLG